MTDAAAITVRDLTLYDEHELVLRDVSFDVQRGDGFAIMGSLASGKRTLLAALIGLVVPDAGQVRIAGHFGVVFQTGALWRDLTLHENVALPLEQLMPLSRRDIRELADLKLALVGLDGDGDLYPEQVTGSMQKRAALARALALDPEILFIEEPSAGLDPLSARGIDELVVELRDGLGLTLVVISHDVPSILAIASDGIYLDQELKTVTARGNPHDMLVHPPNAQVRAFLSRMAWKELA